MNYQRLIYRLDQISQAPSSRQAQLSKDVLAEISQPTVLKPLLNQIADQIENNQQPKGGYLNPNGFKAIFLARSSNAKTLDPNAATSDKDASEALKNKVSLRLHVYTTPDADNPHDHRWSFTSRVLSGKITHGIWEESDRPTATPYFRFNYKPRTPVDFYTVANATKVYLKALKQEEVKAGETLYMDADTIHNVKTEPNTVTLIINKENKGKGSNSVYYSEQDLKLIHGGSVTSKKMTPRQLAEEIRSVARDVVNN